MADTKISAMGTLANPPLAPVFDAVITNDGTTATNFQRPQGQINQPAATGTNDGLGILLRAGAAGPDGGTPGSVFIYGGSVTQGSTGNVGGSLDGIYGGPVTNTNATGTVTPSSFVIGNDEAFIGSAYASNGYLQFESMPSTTLEAQGGYFLGRAGKASGAVTNIGGNWSFYGGDGSTQGGSIIMGPGTGSANGVIIHQNTPTADPHQLGAEWKTSVAGVGYVFVESQG
jgi:hypothetical protein